MVPTDSKGHILLNDNTIDMLALSLSIYRKHAAESDLLRDKQDVLDVLEVVRSHDCMVVSQGGVQTLLSQVRDFLSDLMSSKERK